MLLDIKLFFQNFWMPKTLTLHQRQVRSAWLFLIPACMGLMLVAGWPLFRSIYFSFTDASLGDLYNHEFVGFDNYLSYMKLKSGRVIWDGTLADPTWWNAVWNTIRFTLISVPLETFLGIVIAIMLHVEYVGRGLMRAIILVPWAIPTVVAAKMWAWMFHDQYGIINDALLRLHIISEPVIWMVNLHTAMWVVIVADVWKNTSFVALLCLAGLQMLPHDMYEAAKIDGIHPIKVFWKVTLPLLVPAILVAMIFRTLDALRIFDLVYLLTPNSTATKTMSVVTRENLIEYDNFAYGSAQSTLLFLIIALFVVFYLYYAKWVTKD